MLLHYCFIVFYLNTFVLLNYDYTLCLKGIVVFMRWYRISNRYQLLPMCGYRNRYGEGKNGIGTSLQADVSDIGLIIQFSVRKQISMF